MEIGISGIMMLILGIIAASVLGQTVIYFASKRNKSSLLMILLGVFSFGYLLCSLMLHVYTLEVDYEQVFKWQVNLYFVQAICMLLVFYQYGKKFHRMLFMLNLFWLGVMLAANVIMPNGVVYASFYTPEPLFEFLGETYYLTLGEIQPMYGLFALVTYVLQYAFLGAMIWSFVKTKNSYKAYLFSLFVLVFLVANVLDVLVDVGQIKFIYSSEYVGILVLFLLTVDVLVYTINSQRFEREVGMLQQNIQSIIENSAVYFMGVDKQGQITYVNTHLNKRSGLKRQNLIGKEITSLAEDDVERDKLQGWLRGLSQSETFDFAIDNGIKAPVIISWTKVNLKNGSNSLVEKFLIGVDITENRRAQEDLRRINAEVEAIRTQLENENTYLKEVVVENKAVALEYLDDCLVATDLKTQVDDAAKSELNVLLIGESGVGKEAIAESMAHRNKNTHAPFLTVKCGAFSTFQLEAELFGYVKGAFLEAHKDMPGKLGLANGGILFLDRVHELSVELQRKIVYVLESGEYKPMGSHRTYATNFKLVCSSNLPLSELQSEDILCKDFFYLIATLPIVLPPLRKRIQEFDVILSNLLRRYAQTYVKEVPKVSKAVMQRMKTYHWPGNVRELCNVIEHFYISSTGTRFKFDLQNLGSRNKTVRPNTLAENEKAYILKALKECEWKVSGKGSASEYLGLNESTLRSRMRKMKIERKKS